VNNYLKNANGPGRQPQAGAKRVETIGRSNLSPKSTNIVTHGHTGDGVNLSPAARARLRRLGLDGLTAFEMTGGRICVSLCQHARLIVDGYSVQVRRGRSEA
jgi:hypothetical protein